MNENLQEFVSSRGVDVRVDRTNSVIRGVKLLGLQSRNGRSYLPAALADAVGLYEGAKVNVNHPKGHPAAARDYQDRLGSVRNVSLHSGQGLFADFHFNPKHQLAEQLLWDAEHAPENLGFSHNVEARTGQHSGRTVVEAILKVQSIDLVADPATTRSLFESEQAHRTVTDRANVLATLTLAELQESRSDLLEAVGSLDAARVATLEAELAQLRASEAQHRRRHTACQLLREFKLPTPDAPDAADRLIVSPMFWDSLMAAPSEQVMRALIEERVALLSAARQLDRPGLAPARPVSRQPLGWDAPPPCPDAKTFARLIT